MIIVRKITCRSALVLYMHGHAQDQQHALQVASPAINISIDNSCDSV